MKVDGIEIVIESDAKKAIAELDKLIAKLGQASTAMQSVKGMKNASTGIKGTANSLKSYTGTANKAAKSTFSLASAFGKFYASCFLVIRGVKAIGKSIESSMDYIETYNYYNVIMDKIGTEFGSAWKENGYSSAEDYANSFRDRLTDLTQEMTGYKIGAEGGLIETSSIGLGVDPEKLLNFQAKILSITNSVGMLGENSLMTADALSRLVVDMSSLKNIDLDSVMNDYTSGIIGQSRALYKYGSDITNTKLAEYALAEGIKKKVSEMTQAEKMQLRLIAMMDTGKVSYGDMANSIGGVANQYRLFKQQVSNLARTFGNLFVPILQSVLPIINGITIALTRMFSWIGTIIYGSEKWKKIMDGVSKGYTDTGLDALNDDAEDVTKSLEDANKAASKLKKTVHGYDELHIATDNSSGSDSSKIGGSGGIDLSGQIADALADYESVWDDALAKMQNKAQAVADNIARIATYIGENLAKGFKAGFASDKLVDLQDVFKRIEESNIRVWSNPRVSEAVDRFASTSIQKIGAIGGAVDSLAVSLTYGVAVGIADANESMEKFNVDKISGFYNNLADANEKIIAFAGAISGIGTAFESPAFSGIAEFFNKVIMFVSGMYLETLSGEFSDLIGYFTTPIVDNEAGFKKFIENIFTLMDNAYEPAKKLLDILIDNSVNWEDTWMHKMMLSITERKSGFISGWLSVANKILENMIAFSENNSLLIYLDAIKQKFEAFMSFINPAILLFEGFSSRVKAVFEGIGIIIKALWITVLSWIQTKFINPLYETFSPIVEKIGKFFSDAVAFVKLKWISLSAWFETYVTNPISEVFSTTFTGIKITVVNIMNTLLFFIEKAVNFIVGGINTAIEGFNKVASWASGVTGKSYSGVELLKTITIGRISAYATGGFPEDGLFMANHGEMVGNFSNGKTAVANNEQIVEGIKQGVTEAMMNVLMSMDSSNNQQTGETHVHVHFGSEELGVASFKAIKDGQRRGLIPQFQ